MGIFRRIFGSARAPQPVSPAVPPVRLPAASPRVVRFGGSHDLEVVGESFYQDELWYLVGGRTTERMRVQAEAVLVAESDNPHDPNAIAVRIGGMKVGHLSREDAVTYRPGLIDLERRAGGLIGLQCVIVGGGVRQDGPGLLGVWLSHDPADFGVAAFAPPPAAILRGSMRTGLTEALLTDAEDDSYDLSWLERLPSDTMSAISALRRLLQHDPDPIDRHFMFCELEERLYKSRDAFTSALQDYDEVCARHDAEMDGIRQALLAKFGAVPLLDTYRQMAIRQQKAKNWAHAVWWTERGLSLYGDEAARPEAVEDLNKRLAAYRAKLAPAGARHEPGRTPLGAGPAAARHPVVTEARAAIETLLCAGCGGSFDRPVTRGRKPRFCPSCR